MKLGNMLIRININNISFKILTQGRSEDIPIKKKMQETVLEKCFWSEIGDDYK